MLPPLHTHTRIVGETNTHPQSVTGTPIYALHHNPAYFPSPHAFDPERWLQPYTDADAIESARAAFTPFSIGPRGCIGKSVAYVELRLTVARLMWEFDIKEVVQEGKGALWREGVAVREDEFRLLDHFTSRKEGPVVVFERR